MLKKIKLSPMLKEVISQILKVPATQKYPVIRPEVPEGLRGKQIFDVDLCISCGLCASDCPAKAIEMVTDDGKKRPMFHLDRCVFCYQCAESCPRNAIKDSGFYELASSSKHDLVIRPVASQEKDGEK
jgi:formate hydrogenlyase subunit 6/NADH:ubiquinone oxidoreductase subunit I